MSKKAIGIDVGSQFLKAVQLSKNDGRFEIEKTFTVRMRRSTDSTTTILRSLIKEQDFDKKANVVFSIPAEQIFFNTINSEQPETENLAGEDSLFEDKFPLDKNDIAGRICSRRSAANGNDTLLTAAASKNSIREYIETFNQAGIRPVLIEPPIFAIHRAVRFHLPEIKNGSSLIACLENSRILLAVSEDDEIIMVRNIPVNIDSIDESERFSRHLAQILAEEIRTTWGKIYGGEPPNDTRVCIAAQNRITDLLKPFAEDVLPGQPTFVVPDKKLKYANGINPDQPLWIAEGLALSRLQEDKNAPVNFICACEETEQKINHKKEIAYFTVLLLATAAVWMLGLFVRLSKLESQYTGLKNETTKQFQAALPGVKNIVAPLAQIEQKLGQVREDYQLFEPFCNNDFTPLKVLSSITSNIPSQGDIQVDQLLVTDKSARITAGCDSFKHIYKWQELLLSESIFGQVEVKDNMQKEQESGKIHFTIIVTANRSELK